MRIYINKAELKDNLKVLLNRLGYHQNVDRQSGQASFARRLGGYLYPRFHVYINENQEQYEINVHFDEKKASYAGTSRHSGQYDSELVQAEAQRIQNYITVL
ncbi:MAG: hypothetical protein WCV50_02375 [Patescibacteria group bacterium]|jgi:hypothetical protein